MADIPYRGNLKTASFPFLSELFGRSVIVKKQDQNYIGGLAAKESLDSSIGVPQLYYCHNVIPIDNGYKSVGYVEYVTPAYPSTALFGAVHTIRNDAGDSALITTDAVGNVYILEAGSTVWSNPSGAPAAATIAGKRVTVAFVSGITYIYFENVACYTYDWGTGALSVQVLAGLTAADIIGVVGNQGYLIAYSINAVAWSSTIDPTDFVPSLETGAGGGNVEGVRGVIVTIEEVYGGLIAFAANNAVAIQASNNVRFPFNFVPITGSGGLTDPDNVTQDSGSGSVYAYTTSGLQLINLRQAQPVFPEATDFISGSLMEDYNDITNELVLIDASGVEMHKRLSLVADRYLIISYGVDSLTHALYYDTAYKQFGRLKIEHTDCFEFTSYAADTVEVSKRSIAFITASGGVFILNSDIVADNSSGTMLLGKFQYIRDRFLTLQEVAVENVNPGDTFELLDLPSIDGKTYLPAVSGYLRLSAGKQRVYNFYSSAMNHTIVYKGAFTAVSIVMKFTLHGAE